jgi:hypothetical protein
VPRRRSWMRSAGQLCSRCKRAWTKIDIWLAIAALMAWSAESASHKQLPFALITITRSCVAPPNVIAVFAPA